METTMYDLSEAPKYIMWERPTGKTIYYEPLITKQENEGHSNAYEAMYVRHYCRNNVRRYQMDEYLFRVEGPTLAEAMQRFADTLQKLQKAELIRGRYLCAENIKSEYRELIPRDLYVKLDRQNIKYYKDKLTHKWQKIQ